MREADLRPGERVLHEVHHHGLYLFWPIVLSLVAIGIPWLIYRIFVLKTDIWVITDRRLVDEVGILSKRVKESPFEKIHNATYTQSILGRLFNFGDVEIQTASTEGSSTLTFVKDPARVCRVLMEAVDADIEGSPARASDG